MTESQIKSSLSGLENGNQKLENQGDPIQISTFNFPLPKTNVAIKGYATLDYSLVIVRLLLGLTVAAHGAQKLVGWFGGYGYEGTMWFFTETIGLPYVLALAIILTESLGMIAFAFGLFTRFLSTSLIVIMLGAIFTVHGQFGFFMNWEGNQGGEGFEFHLLVIALAAVTAIHGAGAFSFDNLLFKRKSIQQNVA